ncbi:hypothetical protein [Streptomyces yatensis]|uniref:Uncharacterized protein n=1 Tax=Streptomyces yatensis TaxID=155177 RepID=A0ABP4UR45_9ACTN|nr:hypothetical protein [Streptomyces yatensis]
MPIIGPGPDDPEYDNWDPSWRHQDTPFRRWLLEKLTEAGWSFAAETATSSAPANRYHGLTDIDAGNLASLIGCSPDEVRAAHKADLADWRQEQQLRDHPDLAVLDVDLDRLWRRS